MDPHLGRSIVTDSKRLQQVLKNLLSNAFKFTEHGGVRLSVSVAMSGWTPGHPVLASAGAVISFEVEDTGIGIPAEKQRIIFEAFQQVDASTSRKFGGTGLGLAITRELASLLGGEIQLRSIPGIGSTFTFYLPQNYAGPSIADRLAKRSLMPAQPARTPEPTVEHVQDDRAELEEGDPVLLIVEGDAHYASVLADLARESGFKILMATRGAEALALVRQFRPSAVSLDVFLPDMLGWTVVSHLKQDVRTRHIPVQIVSLDEDRQHALAQGAFCHVTKPATAEALKAAISRIKEYASQGQRRLLVVEDNAAERLSITELLRHDDLDIHTADGGAEAIDALRGGAYDCVVLDLRLPDMSGFEVLQRIRDDDAMRDVPVVVFTGRELSSEDDSQLRALARSVVVKGVESPERLFDETALVLHRVIANLPAHKQKMLERLHRSDEDLIGKQVLIVDDDVRNIFALSSVLERRGMKVSTAGTGRQAIEMLRSNPDTSIVLMDIMMPEMDGYRTMQAVRANPSYQRLPIIALTAKAMKGDREKCLEAGASD
jgi:CheY-like chemotaxis protein